MCSIHTHTIYIVYTQMIYTVHTHEISSININMDFILYLTIV